jgi:hypothetical protein
MGIFNQILTREAIKESTRRYLEMSADCIILLPGQTRLGDVANVIGILAGCERKNNPLSNNHDNCEVRGIRTEGSKELPECARIYFEHKGEKRHVLYHFECGYDQGTSRLLLPRSTPFWCAVGSALVDLFGGKIAFNDSNFDYDNWDYINTNSPLWSGKEDNNSWDAKQKALFALNALSDENIAKFDKISAYGGHIT